MVKGEVVVVCYVAGKVTATRIWSPAANAWRAGPDLPGVTLSASAMVNLEEGPAAPAATSSAGAKEEKVEDEEDDEEAGRPFIVVGAAAPFDAAPRYVYQFAGGQWRKLGRQLEVPREHAVAIQVPNSFC